MVTKKPDTKIDLPVATADKLIKKSWAIEPKKG